MVCGVCQTDHLSPNALIFVTSEGTETRIKEPIWIRVHQRHSDDVASILIRLEEPLREAKWFFFPKTVSTYYNIRLLNPAYQLIWTEEAEVKSHSPKAVPRNKETAFHQAYSHFFLGLSKVFWSHFQKNDNGFTCKSSVNITGSNCELGQMTVERKFQWMVGGGMRGRGWGKCAKKMNGDRGLMRAILSLQGGQRTSEQVSRAFITKKGV